MALISNKRTYIIIPVHNRKDVTLRCLERLHQIGDLQRYSVCVVDDGSSDGTVAAIAQQFPQVTILTGDGNLWWTGAIVLGMEYAYAQGADFFVWLNDDTLPEAGAIASLIRICQEQPHRIAAAQCYADLDHSLPTYGGFIKRGMKHISIHTFLNQLIACDMLCGNLVCLPASVIHAIGYPPEHKFPHYHADCFYTWLAKQRGYEVLLVGSAIATCLKNLGDSSWLTSDIPIGQRWQSLRSPKSPFYIPGYWHLCISFWGIPGILVFIQPYLRLLGISILRWIFPLSLLRSLKAKI